MVTILTALPWGSPDLSVLDPLLCHWTSLDLKNLGVLVSLVVVQLLVALDGPEGCDIWDLWRPHEPIQDQFMITVRPWGNYDPLS